MIKKMEQTVSNKTFFIFQNLQQHSATEWSLLADFNILSLRFIAACFVPVENKAKVWLFISKAMDVGYTTTKDNGSTTTEEIEICRQILIKFAHQ